MRLIFLNGRAITRPKGFGISVLGRSLALGILVVSLLSACGGTTDAPGGTGGVASGGGTASGGSVASGGLSAGSGGSTATGGTGGEGGAGCIGEDCSSGASCVVDDVVYATGDAVPSGDCNTCGCQDGQVLCTLIACAVDWACQLPFEGGNCDAYFPVFAYNSSIGDCEQEVYGGCGGNENRFETIEECRGLCDSSGSQPLGASCEVDGVVYEDGADNVPDPMSCNTCGCQDGVVGGCTEIGCATECPEGDSFGTECSECGPTDACQVVRSGCLTDCTEQEDCAASGKVCLDGQCRSACG